MFQVALDDLENLAVRPNNLNLPVLARPYSLAHIRGCGPNEHSYLQRRLLGEYSTSPFDCAVGDVRQNTFGFGVLANMPHQVHGFAPR
jgi:hypothetical protein